MHWTRRAWYLLLTLVAVVFAESFSWSTPVIIPDGPLVWLIYALHTILIVDFLAARRALTLRSLAAGGVVLGFTTESLMTKVIWNPPWQGTVHILGLGLFEVGFVVLVWHAWMSLALPVALTFSIFGQAAILKKPQTRRTILLLLPLTMWLAAAISGADWPTMLRGVASHGIAIGLLAGLYLYLEKKHPLTDLRLTRWGRALTWGLTILVYALLIPDRFEAFPSTGPLLLGLALVGGSILFLFLIRRAEANRMPPPTEPSCRLHQFVLYCIYFAAVSLALILAVNLIAGIANPTGMLIMYALGIAGDVYMFVLLWQTTASLRWINRGSLSGEAG